MAFVLCPMTKEFEDDILNTTNKYYYIIKKEDNKLYYKHNTSPILKSLFIMKFIEGATGFTKYRDGRHQKDIEEFRSHALLLFN